VSCTTVATDVANRHLGLIRQVNTWDVCMFSCMRRKERYKDVHIVVEELIPVHVLSIKRKIYLTATSFKA